MEKRIALCIAPGLEECEGLIVCDILRRASHTVDLVSFSEDLWVTSSHNVTIKCDFHWSEINFSSFDALVLPGGIPGTYNLEANKALIEALKDFDANKKLIAAICAAPTVFANAGLLENRKATCNPHFQSALKECGACVEEHKAVVQDGYIITSQGLGTAFAFSYALLKALNPEYDVCAMKQQIVDVY